VISNHFEIKLLHHSNHQNHSNHSIKWWAILVLSDFSLNFEEASFFQTDLSLSLRVTNKHGCGNRARPLTNATRITTSPPWSKTNPVHPPE
jgi:hypothetical protein